LQDAIGSEEILVPTDLPAPFKFEEAIALQGMVNMVFFQSDEMKLGVTILPSIADIRAMKGDAEPVFVNGKPGFFMKGEWGGYTKQMGEISNHWSAGEALKLFFEREDRVIGVHSVPVGLFDEATLIKIAESLEWQ